MLKPANLPLLPPLDLSINGPLPLPLVIKDWLAVKKQSWINGAALPTAGASFTSLNPATGDRLSEIVAADKNTVDLAVLTARATFESGVWRDQSYEQRAKGLRRLSALVLEHRSSLALIETLDNGKPIRESYEGDILRAAQNFDFFAGLAPEITEKIFESNGNRHVATREPLGVVALITPWNLPLYLATWKIAPALLMGNSVVLKPSEVTPLTAAYFAELTAVAGLPPGVFNVVHGFGEKAAGEWLVSHPEVNAISFTGETGTGRAIMRAAAAGLTRVSFELGGKGAMVVFEDGDLKAAVAEAVRAAFRNQGEICLACPRLYIAKPLYETFKAAFLAAVSQIKVGDPLNPATTMGALVSEEHFNKVVSYGELAAKEGLLLAGGKRAGEGKGNFYAPTVVEGLSPQSRIQNEEIFGPLVSLTPFTSEAEVIELVNATPYGLSASLWTSDRARAERVAGKIRTGLVWINSWFVRDLRVPFGGQKKSGIGREGGTHSLEFFSEWKSVCFSGEFTPGA